MLRIERTNSENPNFEKLVVLLDSYLAVLDGEDHAFYAQFNKTNFITEVIVAYENEEAVGCGAFKKYDEQTVEIKRMYVLPDFRGKKIAQSLLSELEKWAAQLGFLACILETGYKQEAAIKLYHNCGYHDIENYGQYIGIENSVCMKKNL
ncbi:N-acetyltransferase [Flavobacterium noncentrifugens]|uniref:Acetyltransferase (GNAT) family protein n=1 Tax=Flavobacterium noncentrifugens TaxID=1128970 RepID=A0A1G8WCL9_9FLAO|nr:GNAT family N-acetyltransferase [Flavobacterium noncentrifugens]GEP50840.1 N-acetyltransferase [Flavobacterium noncentrifugens]SDJ75330.1 Acetyltransferase (GNAT) family protein [Flavobacterium noncentrifugens]